MHSARRNNVIVHALATTFIESTEIALRKAGKMLYWLPTSGIPTHASGRQTQNTVMVTSH